MTSAIESIAVWLVDFYLLTAALLTPALAAILIVNQPARRLAITKATLVALLLLTALSAAPGWSVVHLLAPQQPRANGSPGAARIVANSDESNSANMVPIRATAERTEHRATAQAISLQPLAETPARFDWLNLSWQTWFVVMFMTGAVCVATWLALGALAAFRLRRGARPAPPEILALLDDGTHTESPESGLHFAGCHWLRKYWFIVCHWLRQCRRLGQRSLLSSLGHRAIDIKPQIRPDREALAEPVAHAANGIELLLSDRIDVAVAMGVWRPVVLLPAKCTNTETPSALRSVLAHEIAHVRGHDLRWLAISRALSLLLWSQPLFWLLRRQMRLDQEALADAAAADLTTRHEYAEQLVAWARSASARPALHLSSAVGLWEGPSQLKRRIALLLDDQLTILRNCSRSWRGGSIFLATALAVLLSFVTLQPPGHAESTESATQGETNSSDAAAKFGTLVGRFIFDGTPPPPPKELEPPIMRTLDGREVGRTGTDVFNKYKIVDESLVVGDEGGIANVFVWVRNKNIPTPPIGALPPVVVSCKDGRYIPHAIAFQAPRELTFQADDEFPNNFYYRGLRSPRNQLVRPGQQVSFMARPEVMPVRLASTIHPWLNAWLLPLPHPYFSVSDNSGEIRIEGLPPGEWEFQVWHERSGRLKTDSWPQGRFTSTIEPGLNDLGSTKLGASVFEPVTAVRPNSAPQPASLEPASDEIEATDETPAASPSGENGASTETYRRAASPTFIVAKHVILQDGKIIEWADIERIITELSNPERATPALRFTNGALPRQEDIRAKIWNLRKRVALAGHSWGSILPRASARYDSIRTAADLAPNEAWRVEGVVETSERARLAGAEIVLCPPVDESVPYKTLDITLRNGRLRERHDEIVTDSDAAGRFAIYPPPGAPYYVLALHRDGFGLVRSDEFAKTRRIEIQPWARVTGRVMPDLRFEQSVEIDIDVPAVDGWPELLIGQYGEDIDQPHPGGQFEFAFVPPRLRGLVRRQIKKEGGSIGLPYESMFLKPGETLNVDMKAPSEAEVQRFNELSLP